MKTKYIWLVVVLLRSALPSDAQLLKNMVNNMKNNNGNRQGGRAVSPADSAAAITSFMTGTGGAGWLYQYRVAYTIAIKNKNSVSTDTTSTELTDTHNARTDLGAHVAVIGHAGMPRFSVTLHQDSKTYTLNVIDTAAMNGSRGNTYQVTKVGNETVQGYNCIHARMTTVNAGKPLLTQEIWTSKDVPGYALMKRLTTLQNLTLPMLRALEQAGCDGMFVKMTMQGPNYSMDMQLIDAERKTFPDAMFQIPPGYRQKTK
jgi:hypothetical protein